MSVQVRRETHRFAIRVCKGAVGAAAGAALGSTLAPIVTPALVSFFGSTAVVGSIAAGMKAIIGIKAIAGIKAGHVAATGALVVVKSGAIKVGLTAFSSGLGAGWGVGKVARGASPDHDGPREDGPTDEETPGEGAAGKEGNSRSLGHDADEGWAGDPMGAACTMQNWGERYLV